MMPSVHIQGMFLFKRLTCAEKNRQTRSKERATLSTLNIIQGIQGTGFQCTQVSYFRPAPFLRLTDKWSMTKLSFWGLCYFSSYDGSHYQLYWHSYQMLWLERMSKDFKIGALFTKVTYLHHSGCKVVFIALLVSIVNQTTALFFTNLHSLLFPDSSLNIYVLMRHRYSLPDEIIVEKYNKHTNVMQW